MIDREAFSFCEFWRATPADLNDALDDELVDWVEGIFFQFRKLELMLGLVDEATRIAAPASRRPRATHRPLPIPHLPAVAQPPGGHSRHDPDPPAISQRPIGVPDEVLKFAPKKVRGDGVPIDQCGSAIVEMLQRAGQQLGAAEDRISRLETEIERVQDRAVRAESWLEQAQEEIEEKLIEPATAARSKLDDLGP